MKNNYSFTRYLAAKKSVDDRALNWHVWQKLKQMLPPTEIKIVEVGAGIGTMIERLIEHAFIRRAHYTAIDNNPAHEPVARRQLATIPAGVRLTWETIDLFDFTARERGRQTWDLLIAHAFLDLVDIPATLPLLFSLLPPGGLFYFSLNFDGATILQPTIDPIFDARVEKLYHQTMDERIINGKRSGDSQSGRHLFHWLPGAGATILAAGSSDWIVFAGEDGYPGDEAYFLHFIIHTIHGALHNHPELDATQFEDWIKQRQAQIEAGKLIYIAHQIDFVGKID